jgi:Meiotically up-regulated gene 113
VADEISSDGNATGFVYVARCRGFHKIGWTEHNPADRVKQLQTGCPFPIELVGTIPATPADDTRWRKVVFKDKHVRGDWFRLALQDVQNILRSDFTLRAGKWASHQEATLEGLRLAREQGRKGGGRAKLTASEAEELRRLRSDGSSPWELMAKYRISRATLYRYLQAA